MYIQNCEIEDLGNGKVKITGPAVFSGKEQEVITEKSHLEAYKNGKYVQEAFPDLSADEREFLISGVEIGEFDDMFPEE